MDEINQTVDAVLKAIQDSEIYKEYHRQEELLSRNPALSSRVNQFRADNFMLQEQASSGDLVHVVDEIYRESRLLHADPQVNAYLYAELALCKLMQRISQRLCEGLDFTTPDFE